MRDFTSTLQAILAAAFMIAALAALIPSASNADPEAEADEKWEFTDLGSRYVESLGSYSVVAVRVEVANRGTRAIVCRIKFQFLDGEGFELDSTTIRGTVPVGGGSLTDQAMMADHVYAAAVSVAAAGSCR